MLASRCLFACLLVLATPTLASAHGVYADLVPNSDVNGCLTCHNNSSGGNGCGGSTGVPVGPYSSCRNVFGYDFGRTYSGHTIRTWDAALRDRDSDGDGRTNGQELVYFGSSFSAGAAGQGSNTYVTRPGSSTSRHTNECVLQASGTWGFTYSPRNYTNCTTSSAGTCTNNSSGSATPSGSRYFGFTCGCDPGYTGNGRRDVSFDGVSDSGANGCSSTQCTPTRCGNGNCVERSPPQTYTCNCDPGYVFSGGTCQVNNPCIAETDDCDANAQCAPNASVGWICTCNEGWNGTGSAFRGTGDRCTDIEECAGNPCGAGHRCIEDAPASYRCACLPGYEERDGTCVDINECTEGLAACDELATCENRVGGYDCVCGPGYEGSGFECGDFDECEVEGSCHAEASCTNEFGGFSCTCNEGYYGNGQTCLDVDDCQRMRCERNEECVNPIGEPGYCVCQTGYERADEDSACEPTCGDGVATTFEPCDDGNSDAGDGCDASCEVELGWACRRVGDGGSVCMETCGDGLIHDEAGETCDDGEANNSDTEPDACRARCMLAGCGDGVIDTGEECDDAAENSDEDADACRTTCVEAYCGDGVLDTGEQCDPGGGEVLPTGTCARPCSEPDGGLADGSVDGGPGGTVDGGCTCRAGSAPRSGAGGLLGLAILLGALARRRRRD